MASGRPGDKPIAEEIMVSLLTHKCVTRPQWVNDYSYLYTTKLFQWYQVYPVPRQQPWKYIIHLLIDGFVQDCSNSSVLAMGLLQSSNKPSRQPQ